MIQDEKKKAKFNTYWAECHPIDYDENQKREAEKAFMHQQQIIENLAMLIRMMLSDRECNRKAKDYLIRNDLMGSVLRDG